ncbi:Predicted unusual protein kinase [Ceraceosorus bombacis]|uniref:Predicted unusual protein kinase n=1 Tax=Ceraceosorus bombacis TaxID=401625 RepID=A0A0P1BF31_9BASI|nr:Predicted unusual protein kinase [Ceraceosorus bombacis]
MSQRFMNIVAAHFVLSGRSEFIHSPIISARRAVSAHLNLYARRRSAQTSELHTTVFRLASSSNKTARRSNPAPGSGDTTSAGPSRSSSKAGPSGEALDEAKGVETSSTLGSLERKPSSASQAASAATSRSAAADEQDIHGVSGNVGRNKDQSQPRQAKRRRLPLILALLVTAGAGLYGVDEYLNARILQRNIRTLWCGLTIALDYKINFDPKNAESVAALHERCADRLLAVCDENQGLYTKLGQAVASNSFILPKPYAQLNRLLDDAERMPWEIVRKVLEGELGDRLEQVFESINEKPIAAASIAQVHLGILRGNGDEESRKVAVKVQRPQIRAQAYWDLLCFRILLRFYEQIFELPLSYFGQYISDQILQETSFVHEAENSEQLRKYIATDPLKLVRDTVSVPKVYRDLSGERVLVMEYVSDAVKMTDQKGMERLGLSVRDVAKSVCEVFASQIFQYGLVQADGHAGNILVRRNPQYENASIFRSAAKPKHQVILIDHGLVIPLSEDFRRQYAKLWKAIYQVDLPTLEKITQSWGMGEGSSELFASATLMKPWSKPKTEAEKAEAAKKRAQDPRSDADIQKERMKSFLVQVELTPKELIFVGRSMRIIQANCQVLGSPVNRLNILARHAASALVSPKSPSFKERVDSLRFKTALFIIDGAFLTSRLVHWLSLLFRNPLGALGLRELAPTEKRKGLEDDLARGMQEMGEEYGLDLSDAFEMEQ